MSDDIRTVLRICLRELFTAKEPIDLYSFHTKWRFSPFSLSRFVHALSVAKLVHVQDGRMKLTEDGRVWVLANRRAIFFVSARREWAEFNLQARSTEIANSEPYLPKRDKGTARYFEKLGGFGENN